MKRPVLKAVGLLLLIVVGAAIWLLSTLDLSERLSAELRALEPEIEAALGREVSFGAVEAQWTPSFGVAITDVRVSGAEGETEPLLAADRASVTVDAMRALTSLGRSIVVRSVVIEAPKLHATRNADGSMSWDDVLWRIATAGPEADDAKKAPEAEAARVVLKRTAIERGQVVIVDHALGKEPVTHRVDDLLIESRDVRLDGPIEVGLGATLGGGARNLEVRLGISAPSGPGGRSLRWVRLDAKSVDLAVFGALAGVGAISEGTLTADLELALPSHADAGTRLEGTLVGTGVRTGGLLTGAPFDLSLKSRLSYDPGADTLDLGDLVVDLKASDWARPCPSTVEAARRGVSISARSTPASPAPKYAGRAGCATSRRRRARCPFRSTTSISTASSPACPRGTTSPWCFRRPCSPRISA